MDSQHPIRMGTEYTAEHFTRRVWGGVALRNAKCEIYNDDDDYSRDAAGAEAERDGPDDVNRT